MSLNRDMTDSKEKKNQKSVRHDFLQGQVNAAEAIMRAAQFEINAKKLPDVKTCKNSVQAWKQFTMYFNIWIKHVFGKKERSADGKVSRNDDPLAYEGIGSYLLKSFGHWAWMLIQEIIVVIALAFNWLFVKIGKLFGFIGFQIGRFFKWIKDRLYWLSLKNDIKGRNTKTRVSAFMEKKRVQRNERATERKVQQIERETLRKEEAARRAAVRKEEEAIRQARYEEAAALKHTQEIEAEIAAIALRRKQEEERVHEQIQKKEEAEKLLLEAKQTEEKERAIFEAQRAEQEKAREEAARQAEEAKARLEILRKEDEERKRLAAVREEELKRLQEEEARLNEEKRLEEERRIAEEKRLEEKKRLAEQRAAEEAERREAEKRLAEEKQAAEEKQRAEEQHVLEEKHKSEAAAERLMAEVRTGDHKSAAVGEPSGETLSREEALKELRLEEEAEAEAEKTNVTETAAEPEAEILTAETVVKEPDVEAQTEQPDTETNDQAAQVLAAERKADEAMRELQLKKEEDERRQLDEKREQEEAAYLRKRSAELKKPVTPSAPKPSFAASTMRNAVKSLPVTMPHVNIPNAEERERLVTEARDTTSNFIRRTIKRSELPMVLGNPAEAIKLTSIKYAIIALITAASSYIGVLNHSVVSEEPGGGSFVLLFLAILLLGAGLEIGGGYLAGTLLNRVMNVSPTAVLERNSVYTIISGVCFSLAGILLIFNKEKFLAVFAALLLLAMIGHIWVLYRVSERKTGYSLLVYLLVAFAIIAVIMLALIVIRNPIMTIWSALK